MDVWPSINSRECKKKQKNIYFGEFGPGEMLRSSNLGRQHVCPRQGINSDLSSEDKRSLVELLNKYLNYLWHRIPLPQKLIFVVECSEKQ